MTDLTPYTWFRYRYRLGWELSDWTYVEIEKSRLVFDDGEECCEDDLLDLAGELAGLSERDSDRSTQWSAEVLSVQDLPPGFLEERSRALEEEIALLQKDLARTRSWARLI